MNRHPTILRLLGGTAALLAAASCGGGGGGEVLQPPIADLTGTWAVQDYVRGDCPGTTYPVYRSWTATVTQSGNTLTFRDLSTGKAYSGTISGNAVTWSISGGDATGTMSGTFTGTASADGNGVSGRAPWTWTAPSAPSCTGTTWVTGSRDGSTPAAPVITAVAGWRQATISWTATPGIVSYSLYRSTSPGTAASGTRVSGAAYGLATLTDGWLTNDTIYYYAVKATDAANQVSAASNEVAATPSSVAPRPDRPTGVTAAAGTGKLTISCDPVAGATNYRFYRSTTPNAMSTYDALASHLAVTASSCKGIPVGGTAGTTTYVVVTAWNVSGESEPSAEVSAVPQ